MTCLFCKICQGEIPATIVHQTDTVMAFNDINPQAPTHVLIIPKKHIETINDISVDDTLLIGDMVMAAKTLADSYNLKENGYRLVFNTNKHGGQQVYHIHLHLLGGRQMTWPPG